MVVVNVEPFEIETTTRHGDVDRADVYLPAGRDGAAPVRPDVLRPVRRPGQLRKAASMTQDHAAQPRSHPSRDSANPLTRKLSHFVPLPRPDQEVLDRLAELEERFPAHAYTVAEGMAPRPAFLLKEGLAARYRLLPDGGRQIRPS